MLCVYLINVKSLIRSDEKYDSAFGAEPSVGPKTVVVGFPRVVVECLLALTERARGGAAAVEGINFVQVGEAKASEAPRALHANGPPDAGLECYI